MRAGLLSLALAVGLLLTAAAPAAALPTPCDAPLVGQACDAVADAAGDAVGSAAGGVLAALTGWVGDGAAWLLGEVVRAIDATTEVDLEAGWFAEHYGFMVAAGGLLLLPLLLLAVVQGLLRGDPALLVRAFFLHLPAAVLLTGLAVAATQAALEVTDALSQELARGLAGDAERFGATFAAVVLGTGVASPLPAFVGFLLALVMALGALAVWIELILRAAGIYIALMFLPLFLAALVWPASARWARRLAELLVALVLTKLVIVACLSLGLSAVASGEGAEAVLAGAAIFLLAAFSPFVLLSLIPLAGEVGHLHRQGRPALAGATGGALVWQQARMRVGSAGRGAAGGGVGAAAGGAGMASAAALPLAAAAGAGRRVASGPAAASAGGDQGGAAGASPAGASAASRSRRGTGAPRPSSGAGAASAPAGVAPPAPEASRSPAASRTPLGGAPPSRGPAPRRPAEPTIPSPPPSPAPKRRPRPRIGDA